MTCLSYRSLEVFWGPGHNPSSSTSSQGSLHKAPEKKGIKSSISRLFRKKEKGRPEHPSKEALGPGGCFTVQREEGLQASPFCVSPVVPTRAQSRLPHSRSLLLPGRER